MTTNILDNLDLQKLGKSLREAREKCGMTQAEAAEVINVARTTLVTMCFALGLTTYEQGQRRLKPTEATTTIFDLVASTIHNCPKLHLLGTGAFWIPK